MAYLEIKVRFSQPEPWKDLFASLLGDAGCDSFMDGEDENTLLAYIKEDDYNEATIAEVLTQHDYDVEVSYEVSKTEEKDWNAVWEADYEPVLIADQCYIRAPFHEPLPNVTYDIVIEPKMSFGTAHHETTALMIEYLLTEEIQGKRVLDMGAGTGVLAILTHQRGAAAVTAIDNDPWAYENNLENNIRNHISDMTVKLGDALSIGDDTFDLIIANINRNILLNDMHHYAKALNASGCIFFSGFYEGHDLDMIKEKAESLGLTFHSCKVRNHWVAAKFVK